MTTRGTSPAYTVIRLQASLRTIQEAKTMSTIQHILVATDFSELADTVVDQAIDLAKQLNANVTLVHSYEIPIYGFPDGVLVAPADVASRIGEAAATQLDTIARKHEGSGVKIATVLRMGAAWDEVNAVAEERKADVIVVGTHGRRGLARALLGSTAERILRTATRPVYVVHAALPKKA
jgi:nucleotide-binding universal stress UspA family protein